MKLLLDSNILAPLCYPARKEHQLLVRWFEDVLESRRRQVTIYVPAITDYEVRRGLLHVALKSGRTVTRSLKRLDLLVRQLEYLSLNQAVLNGAAQLWAQARHAGQPTAGPESLDGDVILASHAKQVSGVVVTENVRHLSRFADAFHWREVPLPSRDA